MLIPCFDNLKKPIKNLSVQVQKIIKKKSILPIYLLLNFQAIKYFYSF